MPLLSTPHERAAHGGLERRGYLGVRPHCVRLMGITF
jgi:hypothetical protein